jgi:DNA-binding response OmpR family regulator
MRVLIADDDVATRHALEVQLARWGYEPIVCADGNEARGVLRTPEAPTIAILDRSMPGVDGVTLCRELRSDPVLQSTYVILLTSADTAEEVAEGFEGGVDDYQLKPFDAETLRRRLRIAARIAGLQTSLTQRVSELQQALTQVRTLSGLLPICSYCKRIRNDKDYWEQLEGYISEHTEAQFSHGVCPECYGKALRDMEDPGTNR